MRVDTEMQIEICTAEVEWEVVRGNKARTKTDVDDGWDGWMDDMI